jgi:hypothetical protein
MNCFKHIFVYDILDKDRIIIANMSLGRDLLELYFEPCLLGDSGQSNIQLSMAKDRSVETNSNVFKRLPLCFIDRDGKAGNHWILNSLKFEWKAVIRGSHLDARKVDILPSSLPS